MSQTSLFDDAAVPSSPSGTAARSADPPRLRLANRGQVEWRSVDLDSMLRDDHEARAMWSAVEKLDLSRFYDAITARGSAPGRGATDPKILVCLWLYATSDGVSSARELTDLCQEHDAYRWICGGVSVNHHTLADFRVDHGAGVDELMTQVLAVMIKANLVTLYRVAQDGTKVRANAGASSFRREKTLQECLKEAQAQVDHLKQMAESPPSEGRPSKRQSAARERAAREREARVTAALAELPKVKQVKSEKDKDKARVSTTDPEARVMKMGDGGFRPAYNIQFATDTESRVIVGVSVTNAGTDYAQMEPMIDVVKKRTGKEPEEYLVDGGYVNKEAIERVADTGIGVFAPVRAPKDPTVDPYKAKPNEPGALGEWRERMGTEGAKEVYKERASTSETVHADLRSNRGFNQIPVRGLQKVTSYALWGALTYNVLRGITLGIL